MMPIDSFEARDFSAPDLLPPDLIKATVPGNIALTKGAALRPLLVLVEFDVETLVVIPIDGFAARDLEAVDILPDDVGGEASGIVTAMYADRGLIYSDNSFYTARLVGDVVIAQTAMDLLGMGGRIGITAAETGPLEWGPRPGRHRRRWPRHGARGADQDSGCADAVALRCRRGSWLMP
jgi:hypothetical protein